MSSKTKAPSLLDALIPIIALIIMLAGSVILYGDSSSYGANQIALLLAAAIAMLVGHKNGYRWRDIETGIVKGISMALGAILILLMVGSLIGTWILSGTVPTMIYYGLKILDPSIFYAAACVVCALVSISIGSSWTTAGTVGVALIGIAAGLELSLPITAGAIISGAYFGDKMSPLSDTTNLAPAVAGTELFTHIRHMAWTTGPSILIAIIIFTVIGFTGSAEGSSEGLQNTLSIINANFSISFFTLLPLFLVLFLAYKKMPAFPTLFIGALVGGLFAAFFQAPVVEKMSGSSQYYWVNAIDAVWRAMYGGFTVVTGDKVVDQLLSSGGDGRGGMANMLNTVWLILCAMTFGAVLETIGLLQRLVTSALKMVKGTGSLIGTVIGTCIGTNIIAADQYIAIVLPGRMYRAEFKKRKLHPKNLSRVLEDSATITSPMIPWNTCGAFMAGTLGVPTLVYLPFCFFNLANPVVSIIYGITHFKIEKIEESGEESIDSDSIDATSSSKTKEDASEDAVLS
ncbi:Na+/H+ antiporter NhaC [Aliikangiella sp. G2MR2-5]|uniref:Na+/H+ antiporter NhaC n=1 Tax=Aliikangiella sp. G2MR2-5 TaxID=2788943 RepID=UPI0018A8E019|nr:Na+/H+ antiporter NhaC [Aliikangiella sp. G2MR2-5]